MTSSTFYWCLLM